jgi:pSer/pThr/pTyr-binding forkhead associated (FHA) protein
VISGDQSISRFHFVISKENGQYLVQDDKSRHGTFLNGNQIATPEPIHDGDVLKVGVSLFWFVIENVSTGAKSTKQEPESMQAEAAELQFGAPEPSSHRIAASATQTNLRPPGSASETGDFLTIDLSEGEALTSTSSSDVAQQPKTELESRRKDFISSLPSNQSESKDDKAASIESSSKDTAKATDIAAVNSEGADFGVSKPMSEKSGETGSPGASATSNPSEHREAENPSQAKSSPANGEKAEQEHNNFGKLFEADPPESPILRENSVDDLAQLGLAKPVVSLGDMKAIERDEPESETPKSGLSDISDIKESADNNSNRASTLTKLAEAAEEAGSPNAFISAKDDNVLSQLIDESYVLHSSSLDHLGGGQVVDGQNSTSDKSTGNGARSLMSTTNELLSATVPDWCNRYFFGELSRLGKELTDLTEQVRQAEQKIKEIEGRSVLTKSLRNNLLTATGDELVDGCGRVLRLLGWKVKTSDDDKHELRVEVDDKHTCIARVVWTETQADRTHLGQLSISQTRYWCEQGVEPKGILIISRVSESGPPPLTSSDLNSELADYASKKNVCLMTTLQLLAVFKEIALNDGNADAARSAIMTSNGWLQGFILEPNEPEKSEGSRLSSLLSA